MAPRRKPPRTPRPQSRAGTALLDGADPEDEDTAAAAVPSADRFERLRRGLVAGQGTAEADAEDEHAWMTTYTDMVTLLLTCFIMLVSLATFSKSGPPTVAAPPSVPSGLSSPEQFEDTASLMPDALFVRQPPDSWSARLSRDLERHVSRLAVAGGVTVERGETTVTVRLDDRLLFPSGRAEIEELGLGVLRELAPVLALSPARIEVQGHTDSVAINTWLFPSNWELSGARAAAVVRVLIDGGVSPGRLSAVGFADTSPLTGNDTPEGRQANRRVEIVLRTPFDPPDATRIPAALRTNGGDGR